MQWIGMRWLAIALVFTLSACWSDTNANTTGSVNECAAKLYSSYNPHDFNQCVKVCLSCQKGVMTTCSTSCRLNGAN
jgi:hypothetical protein